MEENEDLFHFHEHPNPQCPVGRNVHAVLDGRLEAVRQSMTDSMRAVTLLDLLEDTRAHIEQQQG